MSWVRTVRVPVPAKYPVRVRFANWSTGASEEACVGEWSGDEIRSLVKVWKSLASFKVQVFLWQLFMNKVQTRVNLLMQCFGRPNRYNMLLL